jgi:UDP-galactopyranose mutase
VKRIPIRFDDETRYFPQDTFQALPRGGYTALFERILAHDGIRVELARPFEKAMLQDYAWAFLCLPIDEYFDFCLGRLPYRSIRFHTAAVDRREITTQTATINFTDTSPFTRATYWHVLPGHWSGQGDSVTRTTEEPCDDCANDYERYYPVKTADGHHQAVYQQYARLSATERGVMFLGRCGTYQYLDMHQVVSQTLSAVRRWLGQRLAPSLIQANRAKVARNPLLSVTPGPAASA